MHLRLVTTRERLVACAPKRNQYPTSGPRPLWPTQATPVRELAAPISTQFPTPKPIDWRGTQKPRVRPAAKKGLSPEAHQGKMPSVPESIQLQMRQAPRAPSRHSI